jgi:hypothetical protein
VNVQRLALCRSLSWHCKGLKIVLSVHRMFSCETNEMEGIIISTFRVALLVIFWPLSIVSWIVRRIQWVLKVHQSLDPSKHVRGPPCSATRHQLSDGRGLAYHVYGDLNAKNVIFWLHGLVSSRLEVIPEQCSALPVSPGWERVVKCFVAMRETNIAYQSLLAVYKQTSEAVSHNLILVQFEPDGPVEWNSRD